MLPPRESGAVKESYLRKIVESDKLKVIKKSIVLLKQEFPGVYAIESEWFGTIENLKGRGRPSMRAGGESAGESYEIGVPGWAIWIGFVIFFRILATFLRNQ